MGIQVTIEDAKEGQTTGCCDSPMGCWERPIPNPRGYLSESISRKLDEVAQLRLLERAINWAMLSDNETAQLEKLFIESAL